MGFSNLSSSIWLVLLTINGKLFWIKNYGIPFKSQIKISNDKIYLIDQDNKFVCFDTEKGSQVWNLDDKPSFIKSQKYLGLSLLENKST